MTKEDLSRIEKEAEDYAGLFSDSMPAVCGLYEHRVKSYIAGATAENERFTIASQSFTVAFLHALNEYAIRKKKPNSSRHFDLCEGFETGARWARDHFREMIETKATK